MEILKKKLTTDIKAEEVWLDILKIRKENPLIHNITNYVAMNITANALLALGASPVMAHAKNEVKDMVRIAKALIINIGTLSDPWIESMKEAFRYTEQKYQGGFFISKGRGNTV